MHNSIFTFCNKVLSSLMLSNGSGDVVDVSKASEADSGLWSIISNLPTYLWRSFLSILDLIITVVLKFFYIVVEFMLKLLDLVFVVFRELAGMNTSTNLINAEDFTNSDVLFNFLRQEAVRKVLLRLFGLGLVLLVLFTIVGIIKSEYTAAVTDGNDTKKQVMVSSLRGLFLMFLVPIMAFGGIIMSNTVLTSISSAFNGGADINIGTTVFLSSTYQANLFREYADSNKQIPILYSLEQLDQDAILKMPIEGSVEQMEADFMAVAEAPAWNTGLITYLFFLNSSFFDREYVPSAYYLTYDKNLVPNSMLPSGAEKENGYNTVNNYVDRVDYYVMADLQDTMVKYGLPFYYVRLAAGASMTINYSGGASKTMISSGGFSEEQGAVFTIAICPTKVVKQADGSLSTPSVIEYIPVVAHQRIYYYQYYEIKDGKEVLNESKSKSFYFNTSYLETGSPVLAKGLMSEEGYPTTIRENIDGSIQCYRDYINVPLIADFFPVVTYEKNDSYTETLGSQVLRYGFQTITGLDPYELVPYVYFRFNVWTMFQKDQVYSLQLGRGEALTLNYTFDGKTAIEQHYNLKKINWVIFVFVASFMFGILLKSCFALITRIYDIMILLMLFPMVASTLPLDDGARVGQWNKQFIARLFAAYGLVITLNFVFLVTPVVTEINLFEQYMFTGVFRYMPAQFVNFGVQMMFLLVLYATFKSSVSMISQLLGDDKKNPTDIVAVGESNTAKVIGKRDQYTGQLKGGLIGNTKNVVSGKDMQDFLIDHGMARDLMLKDDDNPKGKYNRSNSWIPGGVFIDKLHDNKVKRKKKAKMDRAWNTMMGDMMAGDSTNIQKGIKALSEDTQKRYKNAMGIAGRTVPKNPKEVRSRRRQEFVRRRH